MSASFILTLSESRLIASKPAYQRFTMHQIAEIAYLYVLGLRILLCQPATAPWAEHYCKKSARGAYFAHWRTDGTDLYNLLHALVDEAVPLRDDGHDGERARFVIAPFLLHRWLGAAGLSSSVEGITLRLFATLDRLFRVKGSLPALRRLVQDWPDLSAHERTTAMTKLLAALHRLAPQAEILPHLRNLARQHDWIADETEQKRKSILLNFAMESASAGGTGAASVATAVGGLGVGFDPDGYERSVYPAPPKRERKVKVIRRGVKPQSREG